MKTLLTTLSITILTSLTLISQTKNIKGTVLDGETNTPLENVNIVISESQTVLVTDQDGNFSIDIEPKTSRQITFSRIGYGIYRVNTNQLTSDTLQIRLTRKQITLGEVTVTSTKYFKLEKDVAIPLEVVSTEKLEKNLSLSVPDIMHGEPGITVVRDGIWGTDINIRGLSRQNVVTLIDGNRIETATNHAAGLSLIDMFDIQRIEVIKGGVSSLYGTGATGGVVNVFTKIPSYSARLNINANIVSGYNSVNQGGIGNLTLAASSNIWYMKLSGSLRSAENTKTPQGIMPNSHFRDNYLSALAGFKPFDNQELKISFQKFGGEDIGIPGGRTFPQTASARYLLAERKMYSAEYRLISLFPSLLNTSIKYFYQEIQRSVELKPNPTTTALPRATHKTNGAIFQTNWLINNNNQLAAGIDFWQRTYNGFRETIVKTSTTTRITADYPVPNSKYMSTGFFAQNESHQLDNKLSVTVGGRLDLIKVTNEETRNPAFVNTNGVVSYPPQNPLASFSAGEYNDKSWSGNIGVLYSFMHNFEVTFNYAHAFRSPVLEERFQYINLGGDVYLGNPNLESERGNFIDVGFRIWSNVISLKTNFFFNSFSNLVVDKPLIVDSLYQKANVGKARLYGFDLGLEYQILSKVSSYVSTSFVRGEDTETKTDLPQIPPLNARIGVKSQLIDYISLELVSSLFAKQNKTAFGEKATPGYVLFDFYISSQPIDFNVMKLKLSAGVENIFDKQYRNHLSTNRGQILSEPGRNFFIRTNIAL